MVVVFQKGNVPSFTDTYLNKWVKKFSCLVYYNARKLRVKPYSLELSLELRVRHFNLILLAYQILLRQQF